MTRALTTDSIVNGILLREGGFVDDSADPGGATIWGLDQQAQAELLGHAPTLAETQAITRDQAAAFYRERYVEPFAFIPDDRLRVLVVDTAVLMGLPWTVTVLQQLTTVASDGILGSASRGAIVAADPRRLLKGVIYRRHLRELRTALADVPADVRGRTRLKDLEGWWERLCEVGLNVL